MADHDHKHGEMDIKAQEEMFAKFIGFTVWAVGIILVSLVLLYLING